MLILFLVQEDIYEEVPGAMAIPPPRQTVAPIPPQTPPPVIAANIPTLPSRTPVLPPRGAAPSKYWVLSFENYFQEIRLAGFFYENMFRLGGSGSLGCNSLFTCHYLVDR